MGDRVEFRALRGRIRVANRRTRGYYHADGAAERPANRFIGRRLISFPDAAISKTLQEQTRVVLATLSPWEEQILRLRFGIGESSGRTLEEISAEVALAREQILKIETQALRKLRHPGPARGR